MEAMEIDRPKLVLNPSLEEQIFSNELLLDLICKHLGTQGLLRASLVNRAFQAKSRELLTKDSKYYPACIEIDDASPCSALLKFSTFLDENYGPRDYPTIFNGIRIKGAFRRKSKSSDRKCGHCSRHSSLAPELQRVGGGVEEMMIQTNARDTSKLFGNILEKIKFRYVRLQRSVLDMTCPFGEFIKSLVKKNAANLLELDFGDKPLKEGSVEKFLLKCGNEIPPAFPKFPKLKVFGISEIQVGHMWDYLQFLAPCLKRINRLRLNPLRHNWLIQLFPFHCITNLGNLEENQETVKAVLAFVKKFEIKIENLYFQHNPAQKLDALINKDLKRDFFELGCLVSKTLVALTCSPTLLTYLAREYNLSDENCITNLFPSLESLDLVDGTTGLDVKNWFGLAHFCENFPKLSKVRLNFVQLKPKHPSTIGHSSYKWVDGSRWCENVQNLAMETNIINKPLMELVPSFFKLFGNISHLNLIGMPFKYDCDDRSFAEILDKLSYLPQLEEIAIKWTDLSSLNLDHLFTDNIPEIEKHLEEKNLKHLLVYHSSIFYHKGLKKICIHGEDVCTRAKEEEEITRDPFAETLLISNPTAQLIRKHRPGFKFSIITDLTCTHDCSGIFRLGGFRFEHLEPHAEIYTREVFATSLTRYWDINFF